MLSLWLPGIGLLLLGLIYVVVSMRVWRLPQSTSKGTTVPPRHERLGLFRRIFCKYLHISIVLQENDLLRKRSVCC